MLPAFGRILIFDICSQAAGKFVLFFSSIISMLIYVLHRFSSFCLFISRFFYSWFSGEMKWKFKPLPYGYVGTSRDISLTRFFGVYLLMDTSSKYVLLRQTFHTYSNFFVYTNLCILICNFVNDKRQKQFRKFYLNITQWGKFENLYTINKLFSYFKDESLYIFLYTVSVNYCKRRKSKKCYNKSIT